MSYDTWITRGPEDQGSRVRCPACKGEGCDECNHTGGLDVDDAEQLEERLEAAAADWESLAALVEQTENQPADDRA